MMENDRFVARRRVQIVNAYGLHVRPATKFVTLAQSFQSDVRVDHQGTKANSKSLLDMTGLAAECGTVLNLEAEARRPRRPSLPWPIWRPTVPMTDEDYLPQNGPREQAEGVCRVGRPVMLKMLGSSGPKRSGRRFGWGRNLVGLGSLGLKLLRTHHVAVIGSDYERSRRFYVEVLGLEVVRRSIGGSGTRTSSTSACRTGPRSSCSPSPTRRSDRATPRRAA